MSEARGTSYGVDERGGALIRLDRPKSRNAIDTQTLTELLEHLAVARADEAVRVLVFSSAHHLRFSARAGGRADEAVRVLVFSSADPLGFSAGADVREQLDHDAHVRRMQLFSDLYDAVVAFPKPTIAACHGDVV